MTTRDPDRNPDASSDAHPDGTPARDPGRPGAAGAPLEPRRGALHTADGLELATYRWTPAGRPRAGVLISHGYAEHALRYGSLAERLCEAGYEVSAFDHRGHGSSFGPRADTPDHHALIDDLGRFLAAFPPTPPRVLLGHSMGGVVAASLVARGAAVDLLVLSSPYVQDAAPAPGWLRALARPLARLLPRLPIRSLDAELLSRDPGEVRDYRDDPLVYNGPVMVRMGAALTALGPELLAAAERITTPTLIVQGGADGVADPAGARALYERLGAADKTLKVYEHGYHELFNDLDRERVLGDLLGWLDDRLG